MSDVDIPNKRNETLICEKVMSEEDKNIRLTFLIWGYNIDFS